MNADDIDNLYNELVVPRVRSVMPGVKMIPLAALREFHDKAGMSPDELANFNFEIRLAGVGEPQMFTYGPDSSGTIPPKISSQIIISICCPIRADANLYRLIISMKYGFG